MKVSRNKEIGIVKEDKGRGVVILDNSKYIEKCMAQLKFPKITRNKLKNWSKKHYLR